MQVTNPKAWEAITGFTANIKAAVERLNKLAVIFLRAKTVSSRLPRGSRPDVSPSSSPSRVGQRSDFPKIGKGIRYQFVDVVHCVPSCTARNRRRGCAEQSRSWDWRWRSSLRRRGVSLSRHAQECHVRRYPSLF